MRKILIKIICLSGLISLPYFGQSKELSILFYSDTIKINGPVNLSASPIFKIHQSHINQLLQNFEEQKLDTLIDQFYKIAEEKELNDWFLYQLILKSAPHFFPKSQENFLQLFSYYLLTKMGYATLLTYENNNLYLNVGSREQLYNTSYTNWQNRNYYSLSHLNHSKNKQAKYTYILPTSLPSGNKDFSFELQSLPKLTSTPILKEISFKFKQKKYSLSIYIDTTILNLLQGYPTLAEKKYFQLPLNKQTQETLFPQLSGIMEKLSLVERVKLLVAFTRTGFEYQVDEQYFGYTKPYFADEVLLYPVSDCEDRAALLFNLVDQLLNLPMVVISYKDHVTIGIDIPNFKGEHISHSGKNYFVCDPTGPVNSTEIGKFPEGYKEAPFAVIHSTKH